MLKNKQFEKLSKTIPENLKANYKEDSDTLRIPPKDIENIYLEIII
jgi:hypothetical protein